MGFIYYSDEDNFNRENSSDELLKCNEEEFSIIKDRPIFKDYPEFYEHYQALVKWKEKIELYTSSLEGDNQLLEERIYNLENEIKELRKE
jgi:hypothetical protein